MARRKEGEGQPAGERMPKVANNARINVLIDRKLYWKIRELAARNERQTSEQLEVMLRRQIEEEDNQ